MRNKLTPTAIHKTKRAGYHSDGGGLYLRVTRAGTRSWIFRWRDAGRLRDMGLGAVDCASLRTVGASLTAAREAAATARAHVHAGRDPIAERDNERAARRAKSANALTFTECARRYVTAKSAGWKNAKHAEQWRATLESYVYPVIGPMPVRDVETAHVLRILEPIWATKTETATRVRQRIERVLDAAKAWGYRSGDNPARWRGHLENTGLPKPKDLKHVRHHAALPYTDMPAFMRELATYQGTTARCLEFTIYTAARTSESRAARWSEVDVESAVWTIPPERIKSKREHRVPLSPAAVTILKGQQGHNPEFVFPGTRDGRALSNMAMLELLQGTMGKAVTVHGFRSTFRDWAAERTNYQRELAEMALAHALRDKTEAAYMRSDMFEKRGRLMNAWAKYCRTMPARNVVPARGRRTNARLHTNGPG